MGNIVTNILNTVAGDKKLTEIDGNLFFCDVSCKIAGTMGGVYGIVIEIIDSAEKEIIFNEAKKANAISKGCTIKNWKPLDVNRNWYPLYWGADLTPGARIRSHVGKPTKTGSIYLIKKTFLKNHNIIYGAIFCKDYLNVERELHNKYKDLFKTTNEEKLDKLSKAETVAP